MIRITGETTHQIDRRIYGQFFRRPDALRLADLAGYRVEDARLEVRLPPRSVAMLLLTCAEAK